MLQIGNSAGISVEALQAEITMLTKLDRRWRKTGSKHALYQFLQAIFNVYAAWKHAGVARTAANRMTMLTGLPPQRKRRPIRTIIDATTTADRRSKSRWTQALRFAWRERFQWKDLNKCLRSNGGIAGCAEKWADLQAEMRTPAGFVRVGGEDRFPRITEGH